MANQQADLMAAKLGETKAALLIRVAKISRSELEQAYIRLYHECADKDRAITQLETKLRTEQYMVGVREAELAELRGETTMRDQVDEEL